MADPFLGEIRAFAFTFAPMGWATCDGQLVQITQNQALYSILGITYGGDGKSTFCLPNLQGRAPMDVGSGPQLTPRIPGDVAGDATVPLTANNFPPHTHALNVVSNSDANQTVVANHYLAKVPATGRPPATTNTYSMPPANVQLAADAVQVAGTASGAIAHDNMQPYLPVLLCIALNGEYPVRP